MLSTLKHGEWSMRENNMHFLFLSNFLLWECGGKQTRWFLVSFTFSPSSRMRKNQEKKILCFFFLSSYILKRIDAEYAWYFWTEMLWRSCQLWIPNAAPQAWRPCVCAVSRAMILRPAGIWGIPAAGYEIYQGKASQLWTAFQTNWILYWMH